jgi:peptidoglycan/xylan/chitin deacetylase (PgdA/CDA1 family)
MKQFIKRLGLGLIPKKSGPVAITLHHVAEESFEWLGSVLDTLSVDFDFMDPIEMEDISNIASNKILITFDDGFMVQKKLVDEVLTPRNIKAIFFIPTGFIGLSGEQAEKFAKTNFFPESNPPVLSPGSYDGMDWGDIRQLLDAGHSVGGHTLTHSNLCLLEADELNQEIVLSADHLEHKLSIVINQFAYPFGSLKQVNLAAVKQASGRFNICYSNIRGMLKENFGVHFIYRQNIVPGMPFWLVKAAVEGRMDWWYSASRKKASSLARAAIKI